MSFSCLNNLLRGNQPGQRHRGDLPLRDARRRGPQLPRGAHGRLDVQLALGAPEGGQGFALGLAGSGGLSVADPNPAGFAIAADMEEEWVRPPDG